MHGQGGYTSSIDFSMDFAIDASEVTAFGLLALYSAILFILDAEFSSAL